MSNALKIIPPDARYAVLNCANGKPDMTIFTEIRGKKLDLVGARLGFLCHVKKKKKERKG